MQEKSGLLNGGGVVRLIDKMGSDYSILRAARVSTGAESVDEVKDRKLIQYLYENDHLTPFEMAVFTFYIKCPLFVAQQILRHRTFSFNQASQRYKEFVPEVYVPTSWREQDKKSKQHSYDNIDLSDIVNNKQGEFIENHIKDYATLYGNLCAAGVAKEQARIFTPSGQYTEMYFTVDLRNLLHFIELRSDEHAQKEIQVFSNAILEILNSINDIKWTMEVFRDMQEFKYLFNKAFKKDKYELRKTLKELSREKAIDLSKIEFG